MNTNPEPNQPEVQTQTRGTRRQYSETFKAELLQACTQPGANTSAVARSHGIRANQLRRWLQKAKGSFDTAKAGAPKAQPQPSFVAVARKSEPAAQADIRMNLQSGATRIQIDWPLQASSQCAQWLLREVLA